MGLITSRLNLDGLHTNRRRSHQGEEQLYSYSLNKNYFSNYFFMGGERFEMNDPDYLFGDSCDLNFLTCTKPYSLPYKKAQQNLLTNLNTKQKAINKVSSRVGGLNTPINILTGRHRQVSQARKQDAQTQTLNQGRKTSKGTEPSQPLIMLINIRKETLRLVKSSIQDSATSANMDGIDGEEQIELEHTMYGASSRRSYQDSDDISSITSNTLSTSQSTHTTGSSTTGKSGYTSVRDVPPSDSASDDNDEYFEDALNEPANDDDNDSVKTNQQKALLVAQQASVEESTRRNCDIKITIHSDEENDDNVQDAQCDPSTSGTGRDTPDGGKLSKAQISKSTTAAVSGHSNILTRVSRSRGSKNKKITTTRGDNKRPSNKTAESNKHHHHHTGASASSSNLVYNIEFYFDTEVDCSIRVSYFCTREMSSNNVTYKPQHATYKSKTYTYKRGLNQKFEQSEHTFQPYMFDEDLLVYKPLDTEGNYNSGAVFPIVIHCVALEGPAPRQSQSLVATVEKSQLDDSYSIKPLKQLIFVDGVQYILQDIYGMENKPLTSIRSTPSRATAAKPMNRNLRSSCNSLHSIGGNNYNNVTTNHTNGGSNMNLSDTASIASALAMDSCLGDARHRGSLISNNQFRSLGSENTFECVICMSEERDTMLLPCRHMCLCSSCAQSLRYQSSTCPICRCPFKAALNVRFIRRGSSGGVGSRPVRSSQAVPDHIDEQDNGIIATATTRTHAKSGNIETDIANDNTTRRESLTNSATPLLARQKSVGTDADSAIPAVMAAAATTTTKRQRSRRPTDDEAASGASVEVHNTSTDRTNLEMRSMQWNVEGGRRVAQQEATSGVAVDSEHQRESVDK